MKLLLLDKDGTLTETVSGEKFVQHPEDQRLIPGAKEAVEKYVSEGWTIVVVTNQGGVASGFKTLNAMLDEMAYLKLLLPQISYILCAHSYEDEGYGECVKIDVTDDGFQWKKMTNAQQRFRKPNPGMLNFAKRLFGFVAGEDIEECLMVGDRDEDNKAAITAGIEFMWAHDWIKQ